MEVDRHNFGQYLPSILDRMSRCVFMSIDNELSGLGIKGSFHFFDTQAERYEKICANALQYPIIQFGLTLFDMNADNGKLDSTCYKFSVFDRHTSRQVAMDTASIKFLSDNNFNFNKLFRDGISWINWHEEKLLWDKLQTDKALLHEMPDHYPDNVKRLAKEQVLPQYHRFWNDCTQKVHVFEPFDEQTAGMLLSVVLKEHEIRKVHSKVQDRLLSSQIYEECVAYVSPDNRLTLMKCLKPCNDRNSTISPILIDNVGFSYIIQQMSRCRRPIVGHNILLDMMHIIDQFIMPLPHEYNRFRTWLHDLFPAIYDTKHMARVLLPAGIFYFNFCF